MAKKKEMGEMVFISSVNDDLLHNILLRLPAKSFASACCVNRFWNSVCNRILSRPKMISAFSRNPDQLRAREEALDKVLSEPIRPHFVIANITCGNMEETLRMIMARVGSRVPIIVSIVLGVLGKEACSDKAGEVKHDGTIAKDEMSVDFAILLTIGYLPGIKVDVIPVIQAEGESEASIGDKFVMDIRNYVSVVSDQAAPACLILFGVNTHATEHIIQKLDYAMPAETIIVGDQKGQFIFNAAHESRNVQLDKDDHRVLAGLIFARDRHRPTQAGRTQFHSAVSRGMSSIDLRYKVANVWVCRPGISSTESTLLTAKRRGEAAVLNGEQIQHDIEGNLVMSGSSLPAYKPYLGVVKRREHSIDFSKSKIISSLVLHQLTGAHGQYLLVEGAGIKTGDYFQIHLPDPKVVEASLNAVSSELRNLKSKPSKLDVVGGFVFADTRRGDVFSGRQNSDSSPLLENFPELPFGGIFCRGEIGRSSSVEDEEEEKEIIHVRTSVYLIVSYTSL